MQARSKAWPRFTPLKFLDEHHYLFHIVLRSFVVAILQSFGSKCCLNYLIKEAKSSYHPAWVPEN